MILNSFEIKFAKLQETSKVESKTFAHKSLIISSKQPVGLPSTSNEALVYHLKLSLFLYRKSSQCTSIPRKET